MQEFFARPHLRHLLGWAPSSEGAQPLLLWSRRLSCRKPSLEYLIPFYAEEVRTKRRYGFLLGVYTDACRRTAI